MKEEILTRFGELGLRVEAGRIALAPGLLDGTEMFMNGSCEFHYCGIPMSVTVAPGAPSHRLHASGAWQPAQSGLVVSRAASQAILERTGEFTGVRFTVPSLQAH